MITIQLFPHLKRYPVRKNELLQAWDSADELMIQHLSTLALDGKKVLILNDSFGALTTATADLQPIFFSDSFVAHAGTKANLMTAGKRPPEMISRLSELRGEFDLVLMKLPKNQSFLEDELIHLSRLMKPNADLIVGVKVKYQSKQSFDLIERYIGKTQTSLAEKKSRLIFAKFEKGPVKQGSEIKRTQIQVPGAPSPFLTDSNSFSREKLDIGTRYFLETMKSAQPDVENDHPTILDLGCGNGILGILAQTQFPNSRLVFADDSQMAIDCTVENFKTHHPDKLDQARFEWTNCFESGEAASLDLVLCNPPFHQENTMGDFIAHQMFHDAQRALKLNGTLRVIGNHHLEYGEILKRIFTNVRSVAKNSKFVILESFKK